MHTPRVANPLLALASAVVVLSALELGVRASARRANGTGYAPVRGNRASVPRTELGYRDEEHPPQKPCGERRLVVLGDSFAWGGGVEFEDAFPERVERGLRRRRKEAWTIVNLSRPGMNTVEESGELLQRGFAFGPDIVLLAYVLNDAEADEQAERRRQQSWLESRAARERQRGGVGLLGWSRLYQLVWERVENTRLNRARVAYHRALYEESSRGWRAAREALAVMAAESRERGVPLVMALFPLFANELDERYPFLDQHAKVKREAAAAGIGLIDLLPAYTGLDWRNLVVDGGEDEHPNEIAHRLAAEAILRGLDPVPLPPLACAP